MSGKGGSGARRKQRCKLESALTCPRSSPTPVFGTPSLPLLGLWASSTQTARILNRGGMEMCDADSSPWQDGDVRRGLQFVAQEGNHQLILLSFKPGWKDERP